MPPQFFYIWYVAMSSGLLHKSSHSSPRGTNWPRTGAFKSFHRLVMKKKNFKISSETMGLSAYIFRMQQCLVVPYMNPANEASCSLISPARGIKSFHRLILIKPFYKLMKHIAYIFTMDTYSANQAPMV